MIESEISRRIGDWAEEHGVFWQRFEDAVARGIPDAFLGLGRVASAWIELKRTTGGAERPAYRPGQLAWALRADARQQRCVTLSGATDGMFRVWDTAAIGQAEAFGRPWPGPVLTSVLLEDAILASLGLVSLPQRGNDLGDLRGDRGGRGERNNRNALPQGSNVA